MHLSRLSQRRRAGGRGGGGGGAGGYGQEAGVCVSDLKFLSNARGSGVKKSSKKVASPTPGTQIKHKTDKQKGFRFFFLNLEWLLKTCASRTFFNGDERRKQGMVCLCLKLHKQRMANRQHILMIDILNTCQIIKSQDQLIVKMAQDVSACVNDEIYTRSRLLAMFFSFSGSNQIALPRAWQ